MTDKLIKTGTKLRIISGGVEGDRYHNFKHGSIVTVMHNSESGSVCAKGDCFFRNGEERKNWSQFVPREYFEIMNVDLNAPVFTTEGTPVEIITTTGRDKKYPVLAYEGKATLPSKFTLEGISKSGEARRNLTNVQAEATEEIVAEAPVVELYANLYDETDYSRPIHLGNELYASAAEANESYKEGRIADKRHPKRIGVAKVTLVKGKLPSRFNKEGK